MQHLNRKNNNVLYYKYIIKQNKLHIIILSFLFIGGGFQLFNLPHTLNKYNNNQVGRIRGPNFKNYELVKP